MFDMLKLKIELWHYNKYAKSNKKRKAKESEKMNPISKKLDDLRRQAGYVK